VLPAGEVIGAELPRRRRRLPDLLLTVDVSSASPTPAERALAAAIYAPIGLGAKVVDDLPDAVAKARQQLTFARFIGKLAVDQGVRELRGRLDGLSNPVAQSEAKSAAPQRPNLTPPTDDVLPDVAVPSVSPEPDELALPDYDQLPAAHIVGKLAGLSSAELDSVEAYESAHRHRRTVLGKIIQLRGD
jgi:hypothetical protein